MDIFKLDFKNIHVIIKLYLTAFSTTGIFAEAMKKSFWSGRKL
jgi:hypothetical protein